jgi:putative hydroxymethylpyrimidine transport system ATP-binding protein
MNNIAAMPAIQIIDAQLRYAHKLIFSELCLNLAAGKFTCLLGPSGVGKSSLLRLLAGLIQPGLQGQTFLSAEIKTSDGLPLTHKIAYLAQADSLLPWLTVLENVVIDKRLRGEQADLVQASHLLSQVGLASSLNLRPNQLSGGMRQRVALARTLYQDRPIVLWDEPFSALDTITRIKLQDLAAELLVDKTVLCVTHDPLEALRLGDEIFIMRGSPAILKVLPPIPGKPPRRWDNDELMHWHALLLDELLQAQEQA